MKRIEGIFRVCSIFTLEGEYQSLDEVKSKNVMYPLRGEDLHTLLLLRAPSGVTAPKQTTQTRLSPLGAPPLSTKTPSGRLPNYILHHYGTSTL
jgi:hypothetical protein